MAPESSIADPSIAIAEHPEQRLTPLLSPSGIERIVIDLCRAELAESRRSSGGFDPLEAEALFTPGTVLLERHAGPGELCLGLDSFERIALSSALNQFFRLHEWGLEDNLLRQRTLGDLSALVSNILLDEDPPWSRLTVRTSGTTAEPKPHTHSRATLASEVRSWCSLLTEAQRVISLVPAHHLYGLIWTVLWPAAAELPVADARNWPAGRWRNELKAGDVIIGVPLLWRHLLRSIESIPVGVTGISSAGALPPDLWADLRRAGLSRMVEVYGSTETAGVGTRESEESPFRLAEHWIPFLEQLAASLPDDLNWVDPDHFRVLRRRDGTVKVGGVLVSFSQVEESIRGISPITDCRVRLREARLEALVIAPVPKQDQAAFLQTLRQSLLRLLPTAAVPARFVLRPALPLSSMGKVTEW